jgi:putative ABC transport system ATP-binding protein
MALRIEQLKKSYLAPDGSVSPVINIDSLALADGEQVALMGSSGSGKTTLLHLIAGILKPDSGKIIFEIPGEVQPAAKEGVTYQIPPRTERDLAALGEAQRDVFRGQNIGYIFQTHHLLSGFTAMENVMLGMSFTGRKHDVQWARHLLIEVGLADRLDYKPAKLSLGQQQRVAVARALANRPKLVLADEPTGSLDANNAQHVLQLIRRLCSEVHASLLLVSHDPQITSQFSRVLKLSEINLAQDRSPKVGVGV